jgi:hypothetical protein
MLPYAKEIVSELIKATGGVMEWVVANKVLVGQKVGEYFARLRDAVKWVIENYEMLLSVGGKLIKVFLWMVGINLTMKLGLMAYNTWLLIVKGTLLGVSLVQGSYNFAVAMGTFLLKGNVWALRGSALALKAVRGALWLANIATTAFTWGVKLLTMALALNPIGLLIIALVAVVGLFGYAWYKLGSFTDALKFMGGVIIKSVLSPVNLLITGIILLLKLASKLPGIGDKFGDMANTAQSLQDKMNLTLTGNKSWSAMGMIYDLVKSNKGEGEAVSSWISKKSQDTQAEKDNKIITQNNSRVDGNIRVSAEPGTKVERQEFFYNMGNNFGFGGI